MADTSKSVGTTATSFSVTPTGGAVYNISFEVPKGIGNMQPKIGLAYNSQGGNGIAGYGFNVTGLSAITRGCKSIYHDGRAQGISHAASDAYFLDGCRLISQSSAEGSDGAVYTPEGSPYTKVTFHGTGTNVWIEVLSQDGIKSEYGRTSLSKQNYTNKTGEARTNAWYLNRQEDALGNYITYSYGTSNLLVYPTAISYGKNTNTSSGCNNVITFEYAMLGDNSHTFAVEDRLGKIDRKLTAVISKTGTDIYRKYTLNYNDNMDNSTTKYSKLTSVVESNGKGEEKNPIVINWNTFPSFSQTMNSHSLNMEDTSPMVERQDMNLLSADLNGDGISDVIRISRVRVYTIKTSSRKEYSDHTYAYIYCSDYNGGNTSFGSPMILDLGAQFVLDDWKTYLGGSAVMDLDGDGISDLLIPKLTVIDQANSKYVSYIVIFGKDIKNRKSNVIGFNCPLINTKDLPYYAVGDFNNDGRDDIITIENTAKSGYYTAHLFYWENSTRIGNVDLSLSLPKAPKKIFTGDYNNDGMTDIIVFYDGGYKIFYNNSGTSLSYAFLNSKSKEGTTFGYNWRMEQGDFNGDGLSDFVFVPGKDAHCYWGLNNGDGTFNKVQACILDVYDKSTKNDDDKFSLLPYDVDHDGVTDLVVVKPNYEYHGGLKNYYEFLYTGVRWYTSDRTKLVLQKSVNTSVQNDGLQSYITLGDFNGDGYTDLMNYGCNFAYSGTGNAPNSIALRTYKTSNISPSSGKVTQFTDGMGQNVSIQYSTASNPNVYTHVYDTDTYPMTDCHMPLHLVSSVTASNGVAGNHSTFYKYKGIKLHSAGKGMLGFTTRTTENTTLGTKETVTIDQWDTERWIPLQTTATTTVGSTSSTTVSTVSVFDNWYKNYFAYTSGQAITDFDGNTTETLTEYDASKGVPTKETVKNDGDNMYKQVEYGGYVQKAGLWMPTTLIKRQKHKDDSDVFSTTTKYTYNDKGDILTTVINAGSSLPLTTTNTYDVYGNVLTTKQTGQGVGNNVKTFVYDSTGRFVVKATESASPAVNTYTYDTWGNVLTECDETNPQGKLTISHVYDGWGRETSVTAPPATTTTTSYGWGSSDAKKYYVLKTPDNAPWVKTWYDNCGREVLVESVGPKNTAVSKATSYNSKGQVYRTTNTTGQLPITETFAYDSRGRVTSDALSSGKTTTYSYGNRSVTATVNDRSYTKTSDAWGNIISSVDPISQVDYQYSSNGQPLQVTASGATTHFEYDTAGNKTSMTDPDAGTTSYTYSADGKILTETDARGIKTTNTYDDGGRLVKSVIGNTTITNTYGTTGNAANRLVKTESGGNSIEYTYDTYGRVTKELRKTNEGKEYTFINGYNNKNQLTSVQYPNLPQAITYTYDQYGNNIQTNAGSNVIYKLESYNGLTASSSFNGALTTTNTRDSRGFLTNVSLTKGGNTLESLTTDYDGATGNLMSRQRNAQKEKFWYDELDRLTEVSENKLLKLTVTYLPNGNINGMTDVGMYTYDDTDRPHAVRSVDNFSEEISGEPATTTFNDINKISVISGDGYAMNLDYGPDCQRWSSVLKKNGTAVRSTVYMGDYEEVTENGVTRGFYYLGDNVLAVRENSAVKYYNIFTDNIGSILSVMDETGNKVFDATYSAWGRQIVDKNTIGLHRGYCSHEMLGEFQLINMNGRLYDPMIGRFLSPDNYVQLPGNSQSYNRYSYCLNNPLKYNDPSGELFGIDDLLIAGVGFVTGYLSNAISTGNWGWSSVKNGLVGAGMAWLSYNTGGFSTGSITGSTWNYSANICINSFANNVLPTMTIPINNHLAFSLSPTFGLGTDGFMAGAMASLGMSFGDVSVNLSSGVTNSFSGWNATASYNGWGLGFGKTYYSKEVVRGNILGKQTVGTISALFPGGSFRLSNDMFGKKHFDRWRTSAAELVIGRFSIGTYVTTNWGEYESKLIDNNNPRYDGEDPLLGYNTERYVNDPKAKAWREGNIYSAPFWIGYNNNGNMYRIGYSHQYVQSLTQNVVHKYLVKTPFFLGTDNLYKGMFSYSGYNNPLSLW